MIAKIALLIGWLWLLLAVIAAGLIVAASLLKCPRCDGWHENEEECPNRKEL